MRVPTSEPGIGARRSSEPVIDLSDLSATEIPIGHTRERQNPPSWHVVLDEEYARSAGKVVTIADVYTIFTGRKVLRPLPNDFRSWAVMGRKFVEDGRLKPVAMYLNTYYFKESDMLSIVGLVVGERMRKKLRTPESIAIYQAIASQLKLW